MNALQIAVVIMITAGALIPAICIIKMRMIRRFLKHAIVTDAVVTESVKRSGVKGSVYYFLSIEYKDYKGKVFTGTAIGSKKSIKGSTIPVMYKETDPAEYKSDFGKYLPWMLGISLIFFGLIVWLCYWILSVAYTMVKVKSIAALFRF